MADDANRALEVIRDVAEALTQPDPTVSGVAETLGTVVDDQAGSGTLVVDPRVDLFERAHVVPADGGAPAHVTLRLRAPSPLTLEALERAFGSYSELDRIHWDDPREALFIVDREGRSHTAAVLAEVDPIDELGPGSVVGQVSVRRDERL